MPLKIAVTGGIASGKSTLVDHAAALGVPAAKADEIAQELRESEEMGHRLAGLLGMANPPAKDELRRAVLEDPALRIAVNSLFHTQVLVRLLEGPAVLCEIPLLIEAACWRFFDQVWTASCPKDVRLERLTERLGDPQAAARFIALQASDPAREAFSDHVFRTNRPLGHVQKDIEELVSRYGLAFSPKKEDIIRVV